MVFGKMKSVMTKRNAGLMVRYFMFAAISTLVNISLLYSLTEFAGIYYLISAFISSVVSIMLNFLLNKYLNFNVTGDTVGQMKRFFAVSSVSVILNLILLNLMVDIFKLWYIYSFVISVFLVFLWSFYGHLKISFRI